MRGRVKCSPPPGAFQFAALLVTEVVMAAETEATEETSVRVGTILKVVVVFGWCEVQKRHEPPY